MDYKIYQLLDDLSDAYSEPIAIADGLLHDHNKVLTTIEFYTNDRFLSGQRDKLGREKPFYNVSNYRVTVAKVATDLDVKNLRFEPDDLRHDIQAMLYNKELYEYLKEINFSLTLNEMGFTRPKYGGVLVKKNTDEGQLKIGVVDWKNVEVDPTNILGGAIIETHYLFPHELNAKRDVWSNIDDVLEAHAKANKGKPAKIIVKELTGEFSEDYEPGKENPDSSKFVRLCCYVACVEEKKFYLYHEEDEGDKYKYLAWERIPGRGLGRGVVEDGFEAQAWINDSMISFKNVMDLAGKVVLATNSRKISGNAIVGIDSGHIFEMEDNKTLTSLNLMPSAMPQFEKVVMLWQDQYNRSASTYDSNTGEPPPAGTPYSQTALLNQVANSPFEYRREEWGIFLNEILNDWIMPHLKKRILKAHTLNADFEDDELEVIDEAFASFTANQETKNRVFAGEKVLQPEYDGMTSQVKQMLAKTKTRRGIEIPEGFLDVKGKLTANITGELKDKAAILQSLDSIFKTVASTFNPQTGTYGALEDPKLSKIFGSIIEMSGVPLSFAQLRSTTKPVAPADLTAVAPQQ